MRSINLLFTQLLYFIVFIYSTRTKRINNIKKKFYFNQQRFFFFVLVIRYYYV